MKVICCPCKAVGIGVRELLLGFFIILKQGDKNVQAQSSLQRQKKGATAFLPSPPEPGYARHAPVHKFMPQLSRVSNQVGPFPFSLHRFHAAT